MKKYIKKKAIQFHEEVVDNFKVIKKSCLFLAGHISVYILNKALTLFFRNSTSVRLRLCHLCVWLHQYTNTPVHKHTSTPVHQYDYDCVFGFTSTHQYTSTHMLSFSEVLRDQKSIRPKIQSADLLTAI